MNRHPSIFQYLVWILLCEGAGIAGSFVTVAEIPAWYASLNMPSWQPPSWIFGPVWTTLYFLMGIAGARIWAATKQNDLTRRLFGAQLFLNALWTPVFFGAHNLLGALVIILAMDVLVLVLLFRLRQNDHVAAWLLAPYFAWILFATVLNTVILALNF